MMLNDESVSDLITINKDNSESDKNVINKSELMKRISRSIDDDNKNELIEEHNDKVFTVNDIQTLMDNQLLHKTQLGENLDNKLEQQQHLILVTQNGDKIILIQNQSINEQSQLNLQNINLNDELLASSSITQKSNKLIEPILNNNQNSNLTSTIVNNQNNKQLIKLNEEKQKNETITNLNENINELNDKIDEESIKIRKQHRIRHQSLMIHYERLKEKFKLNKQDLNDEEDVNLIDEDNDFWEFNVDELNEYEKQKSNYKQIKLNSKRKSIPIEKFYCEAKWYPLFCNNLEKAHNFVRRRSENIEQLSKYFPTASYTFENRCSELKKLLNKLELNLERFQNVLGKDLHEIEDKLKSFYQDYHLEQFTTELEEEDNRDLNLDNYVNLHSNSINHNNQSSLNLKSSTSVSKMELITPSTITITPKDHELDETDPVPEIRDIKNDISLEEMGNKWYSNNLNHLNQTFQPLFVNIKTKKSSRKDNDRTNVKHFKKS